MKRILLFIPILALIFSMTGCQTTELYQQMLIKGFGIDKSKDGYQITVRYASLQQEGEEQCAVTGETVFDAINKLTLITGKKQMYSSAGYVIFGKEVAKEGLDKVLDFFIRYYKTSPTICLFIAGDKASEILNMEKDGRLIPSSTIQAFSENDENKGKTVVATALSFISDIRREGSGAVVPIIEREGKDQIICVRSGAFTDYAMTLELSKEETIGYLAAKGQLHDGSFVVTDEKGEKITVQMTKTSSHTSYKMEEGEPHFTVEIKAEVMLASIPVTSPDINYQKIEKLVSETLYRYANQALQSDRKGRCDLQEFGYMLYIKETEYWKTVREDWNERLSQVDAKIQVSTSVTRIGEEDRPPI